MDNKCSHLPPTAVVSPSTQGCEACLLQGDTSESLRMCLTCGFVGCCNNSSHNHAVKHYLSTGHPLAQTVPPEESFVWCYVDL